MKIHSKKTKNQIKTNYIEKYAEHFERLKTQSALQKKAYLREFFFVQENIQKL